MKEQNLMLQARLHGLEQKLVFMEDIRQERNELREEARELRARLRAHLDALQHAADRLSALVVAQIASRS